MITGLLLAGLAPGASGIAQQNAVAVPGLAGKHALGAEDVGELLLGELMCHACHAGLATRETSRQQGPDLTDVGARIAPEYLVRYIADPAGTHRGTKMPSVLHAEPAARRQEIATAIAAFLIDRSPHRFATEAIAAEEAAAGETLFHEVGCIVCHSPRRPALPEGKMPSPNRGQVDLSVMRQKYSLESLSDFLYLPSRIRPSGRMPDLGLSKAEARALASALIGVGPDRGSAATPSTERVDEGRRYFVAYRCSSCHALDNVESERPRIVISTSTGGCLSASASDSPRYALDDAQRDALAQSIAAPERTVSDEQQIDWTLTAFNCFGCHERGQSGGVSPELDPYFTTSEPELGDEARLPPPLTGVGAKLRGDWLREVVFGSGSVRHYMHTRMPRFEEAALGSLPERLGRVDDIEDFPMPIPEGKEANRLRDGGRELLGKPGLSCISCHDFNGKPSAGFAGIDLVDTAERLEPTWFARFLLKPQSFRRGTVMPEYWPGGVAVQPDILEGETEAQIQALWNYLAQGRTARDPVGIRGEPSVLTVTDTVSTYRGRSRIAGFRGIAVGHPGGVNFAFDAQNGSLAAIWLGEFVSVNWSSQGAGDFNPRSRPIELARDVAFVRLESPDAPWPLRPQTSKEKPVNPDPIYPRQHGYRFEGYAFGEGNVPTLRYRSGAVRIEDRCEADPSSDPPRLIRHLRFVSPEADALTFRLLAGAIEARSKSVSEVSGLRLRVPDVPTRLRRSSESEAELLLELALPAGELLLRIDYEILR